MVITQIPPLSECRRRELGQKAKVVCEDGKVSIRNIRRDSVEKIKLAERNKQIDKDSCKKFQEDVQVSTDKHCKIIDTAFKEKEKSLLAL